MSAKDQYIPDKIIEHEQEHAEATEAELRRTSDHPAVADVSVLVAASTIVTVASPSEEYVQAEAVAARNAVNFLITQGAATEGNVVSLDAKVNAILDVLRDAELIPS